MATRRDRILTLSDRRLRGYLAAEDEAVRARELEMVLTQVVQPRAQEIVESYVRTEWPLDPDDVEDVLGQVVLRILHKLRASTVLEEESIENLKAYVVTVTRNCVRNFMRRRSPERTRLKARFRYLFTHDKRLVLRTVDGITLCGLAAWREGSAREEDRSAVEPAAAELWRSDAPVASVLKILLRVGGPVRLTQLVTACLAATPAGEPLPAVRDEHAEASQRETIESKQYLEGLWDEILALPVRQQTALLLNLREPESGNAVALWASLGIATMAQIASAVQMTAEELGRIWDDLPFDDNRIADHLGVTRQQVINLRKSARERLARRMAMREKR
jgi:DNA-directed RNA polymerase specialized sigma24 family protein